MNLGARVPDRFSGTANSELKVHDTVTWKNQRVRLDTVIEKIYLDLASRDKTKSTHFFLLATPLERDGQSLSNSRINYDLLNERLSQNPAKSKDLSISHSYGTGAVMPDIDKALSSQGLSLAAIATQPERVKEIIGAQRSTVDRELVVLFISGPDGQEEYKYEIIPLNYVRAATGAP